MFKAIAAMSDKLVSGEAGRIPWHLPEDFRWFKQTTMGHILVMGRRTYESIGRPLPGRETWILTRSGFTAPGTRSFTDVETMEAAAAADPRDVFVAGGAEIYARLLRRCGDLYLTRVKRIVPGDAYFPPFEEWFSPVGTLLETPEFRIEHYQFRTPLAA